MTTPLRRTPLADQAADLLWDRIRGGEWELGEKLPGETTLAPQLGVGRSTVREAIRQLAGRGVLSSRQGAGVFVTAVQAPEDWATVLRRAGIVSVLEARLAIETESAALAAERRTPAQLRAVRQALTRRAEAGPDPAELVDADTGFHRAIVVAAGNPILLDLFDALTPGLRAAMVDLLRLRPPVDDHDQGVHGDLADAVAARDPRRAATLARDHLLALKAAIGGPGVAAGTGRGWQSGADHGSR